MMTKINSVSFKPKNVVPGWKLLLIYEFTDTLDSTKVSQLKDRLTDTLALSPRNQEFEIKQRDEICNKIWAFLPDMVILDVEMGVPLLHFTIQRFPGLFFALTDLKQSLSGENYKSAVMYDDFKYYRNSEKIKGINFFISSNLSSFKEKVILTADIRTFEGYHG